jgi:uncharacterized protein YdeI (YjbR/CyaY-like superfamily)
MEIGEQLQVSSREAWRAWLEAQHTQKPEIWLVIYKSTAKKAGLTLKEAAEEAVCFGWVDSQLKPLDGQRYALRFSPRRKQSHWAKSNIERAIRMLREGKMTPAGMAVLPEEVLRACTTDLGTDVTD